jgi:hypothetical protein
MGLEQALQNEGAISAAEKEKQAVQDKEQNKSDQPDSVSVGTETKSSDKNQQAASAQNKEEVNSEGDTGKKDSGDGLTEVQKPNENKKLTDESTLTEEAILGRLNKDLGTQFKSLEDVKNLTSYKDKVSEYESQLQQKNEALKSIGDPYKSFASKKLLKANEILKKNEGMSDDMAIRLATTDFDQMSDDDVLAFKEQMENPYYAGNDQMLKQIINNQYGLSQNIDEEDMDEQTKQMLQMNQFKKQADAKKARDSLKQMADVQTPEKVDVEEQYKQKIEQFRPQAEKIIDEKLDKITIGKNGYEYEIDKGFKDWLKENDHLARHLASKYDPNSSNQNFDEVVTYLKNVYFNNKRDKIIDDLEESITTRIQEQNYKENHNPKENNRTERQGPSDSETYNKEQEDKALKSLRTTSIKR